jgi:hypothetical protein
MEKKMRISGRQMLNVILTAGIALYFLGCSHGGGGSAPAIDCNAAANFNTPACVGGVAGATGIGIYQNGFPRFGTANIAIPDISKVRQWADQTGICQDSQKYVGNGYQARLQRRPFDCMNITTIILNFRIRDTGDSDDYRRGILLGDGRWSLTMTDRFGSMVQTQRLEGRAVKFGNGLQIQSGRMILSGVIRGGNSLTMSVSYQGRDNRINVLGEGRLYIATETNIP